MGPFMGARCRISGVSKDDEDNVYVNPLVVKQVIHDLAELAREESRKVDCQFCGYRYVPLELDGHVRCPRCKNEREEGDER